MNDGTAPKGGPGNLRRLRPNSLPRRRWRDDPREWTEDELMLVVRSFNAVDRAVRHCREAKQR